MSTARRAYDILRGYVGREWERIMGVEEEQAWKELDTPTPRANATAQPVDATPQSEDMRARMILGVAQDAAFSDIRKAFERLNTRSDPAKFPPGSTEAEQAAVIQKKVHWAFGVLTDHMDATEKRFKSLEI